MHALNYMFMEIDKNFEFIWEPIKLRVPKVHKRVDKTATDNASSNLYTPSVFPLLFIMQNYARGVAQFLWNLGVRNWFPKNSKKRINELILVAFAYVRSRNKIHTQLTSPGVIPCRFNTSCLATFQAGPIE